MNITGTQISYYFICHRKLWLFFRNIASEHTSQNVKIGKYYHEQKYNQNSELVEVELDGIKIDKLSSKYVEEFKKSKSELGAVKMQVLFYLWKLKQKGVIKKGLIKFKENRDNLELELTKENEKSLLETIEEIKNLLQQESIPQKLTNNKGNPHKKCKGCSYFEFCWI